MHGEKLLWFMLNEAKQFSVRYNNMVGAHFTLKYAILGFYYGPIGLRGGMLWIENGEMILNWQAVPDSL